MYDVKVAGFDASKDSLAVFRDGRSFEIPNRVKEILRFLKGLGEGAVVAVEATGKYHVKLAKAAFKLGLKIYVVNPRDAKAWKDFTGRRAKNDRVDARELARFVELHQDSLIPWVPQEARLGLVRELLTARAGVVKARVALQQSYAQLSPPARRQVGEAHLVALKEREDALEREIHRLLKEDPGYGRLLKIPGVGALSGAALICAVTGRDFKRSDALVAFFGLDTCVRQSGKYEGRRKLTKRGCALFRHLLCMAARAASLLGAWRGCYEAQLAKGLSATAAYVVLARKIVRTAFSILKNETEFDAERLFAQPSENKGKEAEGLDEKP